MSSPDIEQGSENVDDAPMSCGTFCANIGTSLKERTGKDWAVSFGKILALCLCLYVFLFSLDLMGSSFKVLGGCSAGGMFAGINNPIAGLMIGILATVLVQSSSTSTSIVVSLVGAGNMDVVTAIPVIMGANIGTSVTNTIVSFGQASDSKQLERAFAGATVHDMFNFLAVLVLLPLEAATNMIYHLTAAMTPAEVSKGEKWVGPIKIMVSPLVKVFLNVNKDVTKNVALGKTTCEATYASDAKGLIKGGAFYQSGATLDYDMAAGGVALALSLVLLSVALVCLVKLLQSMVMGTSERMLRKATDMNSYLAIVVGLGITILVQSSSVTTSVLTPLVGVGVLPLEKMFPLTLGANIGTTFTAILASLVSSKPEAVQVALCHLFFNLIGILIWFPIPFMRRVPLAAAKGLGRLTARYRSFPVLYIVAVFGVAPLALIGLSTLFTLKGTAYTFIGIVLSLALAFWVLYTLFWWHKRDGRAKFYGFLERRQERTNFFKSIQTNNGMVMQRLEALEKAANISFDKDSYKTKENQVPPKPEAAALLG